MTATAIIMMILFMVVIWGGMIASMIRLSKNPDETSGTLGKDPKYTNGQLIQLERH